MPTRHSKPIPLLTQSDIQTFWSQVNKTPDQGPKGRCWTWTGKTRNGYGVVLLNGSYFYAHRVAYYLAHGCDPERLGVLHHCDNPPCVNSEDLFSGTQTDNMRDAQRKGRTASGSKNGSKTHPECVPRGKNSGPYRHPEVHQGEKNSHAKLTKEGVQAIRTASGSQREIAERFGTSQSNVAFIKTGKRWSHLKQSVAAECAQESEHLSG